MKIETEDIVFGALALVALGIWFLTLIIFDSPIHSILLLWVTMSPISMLYTYFYKKNNRDMKILRMRFLASSIPVYPLIIYYVYRLIFDNELPGEYRFLPIFILFPALVLNSTVLYFYEIRKNN